MHRPTTTLDHPDGTLEIVELGDGLREIRVRMHDATRYVSKPTWQTRYPPDLIQTILSVKGPAWVCDEIMRDEDPSYVADPLWLRTMSYVEPDYFAGKRILDFGCGAGASTVIVSRRLPQAEMVGIELSEEFLSIARARADHYGVQNLTLLQSPNGESLPDGIGTFDAILMVAVYEHLLPAERKTIMPLLWSHLKPGGILFLSDTPYRYFFHEGHTTGLPLLNYLPDSLCYAVAKRFSKRLPADVSWQTLLRMGIRGGSVPQIMRDVAAPVDRVAPRGAVADQIDLWYQLSIANQKALPAKTWMRRGFKLLYRLTGIEMVPYLAVALQKPG